MPHLDPDRLVLLALSEDVADGSENDHLDSCAGCRTEVESLRHVAGLGAETQDLAHLPPPPEHVWARIQQNAFTPVRADPARRLRMPRWALPVAAAAAAAVLAVAGTVTVQRLTDRPVPPTVTARAVLTPLPAAPRTSAGDAAVLGGGRLRVDARNLPLTAGYYEVWLIDPADTAKMQSLGSLPADSTVVELPIPPGTDLNTYRLVDVSAEKHDGDSAHSGDSLLRGTLTS